MKNWNALHAVRYKYRTQKNRHLGTIAQLCRAVSSQLRHILTIGKNLLNSNILSTCFHNMVNFGLLPAEICWRVWGTPANFNGFRVLAALLHGTLLVGVSQTLRRWTEVATYIRQGGHYVGHWPTFLVLISFVHINLRWVLHLLSCLIDWLLSNKDGHYSYLTTHICDCANEEPKPQITVSSFSTLIIYTSAGNISSERVVRKANANMLHFDSENNF